MRFDVLTIFPKIFDSYLKESLIKRAINSRLIIVKTHDLRGFVAAKDKKQRRNVDDKAFGGGPGMVLKIEPIYKAVQSLKLKNGRGKSKNRIILFSTRGKKLNAETAKRLSKYERLVLISGRYEGVDERVAEYIADEEISVGDYILSGGELPSLVLMETVSRCLPGFLGKEESLEEVKGSYPVYTRPEVFSPVKGKKWSVPAILLSGNHKKIGEWRRMHK